MKLIIKIILGFLILLSLYSCKTRTIEVPVEKIKTEYRDRFVKDSIYVLDSIFINRWQVGDTIYIYKETINKIYKDKIVKDTINIADTIQVAYRVGVPGPTTNKINWWQQVLMYLGIIPICFVGFKIYSFFK